MATLSVSSPTTFRVLVERHARTLKDIVRWVRDRCVLKQDAEYARNAAKANLSSDKSKAIEQVIALIIDVAQRGSVENAAMIGEHFAAIAYAEHPDPTVELSLTEAHILEEQAEGEVEVWETKMARDSSATNILGYLGAAARHSAARRQLNRAAREDLAKRSD